MTEGRVSVLQVITSLAGGAGLHAYQLARHVDPVRFDSRLVFSPGYPLDDRVAQERLPHDRVRWSRGLGPMGIVSGARDLLRILRRTPVDIVHAHCSLAGVIGRLAAARVGRPRAVFTVHAFASRDYQPAWRKRLFLAVERAMDRHTDRYCVTTRAYRDLLIARRIAAPEKICVVPLGVDITAPFTPAERAEARRALGVAAGDLAVVASGRLEPQKGFATLLEAFARVRRHLPVARLVILGDGPLRATLEREADRLRVADSVRFAGWRTDAPRLLAGADVFCLSSLWESFGYVLLEAMMAGVPIVATRLDVTPEVVEHEREALLVEPGDPAALADALDALLRNPERRRALGVAGRERVEHRFPLTRMIAAHEELYAGLAAAASPGFVAA